MTILLYTIEDEDGIIIYLYQWIKRRESEREKLNRGGSFSGRRRWALIDTPSVGIFCRECVSFYGLFSFCNRRCTISLRWSCGSSFRCRPCSDKGGRSALVPASLDLSVDGGFVYFLCVLVFVRFVDLRVFDGSVWMRFRLLLSIVALRRFRWADEEVFKVEVGSVVGRESKLSDGGGSREASFWWL